MLSRTVGKITFHFEPLLVLGALVVIILLVQIIRSVFLEIRFRKVCNDLVAGQYDDVIKNGVNLLSLYEKYNARLSTKQISSRIEYVNFSLSVSYFAKSNYACFLLHINALATNADVKEFWLALYYLKEQDFESAQEHYDLITCDKSNYVNRTFLDAYQAYIKQEMECAQKAMTKVVDQLKHPVLKQLADNILNKKV